MRNASSSKVVLALVLLLVNTCPGCTTRDKGTNPADRDTHSEQSGLRVLPADSHGALLKDILADRRVVSCRLMFESKMLGRAPMASFTVEGINKSGAPIAVTVMVFRGADSTAAGLAAFIRADQRSRVCAGLLRTADGGALSETTPVMLTDYVVTDDGRVFPFEAVSVDTGGRGEGGGYWNCVGASSVAGTAVCAAKCLPAGPAYADCLIACTGWAILASLVACAFAELLGAGE